MVCGISTFYSGFFVNSHEFDGHRIGFALTFKEF